MARFCDPCVGKPHDLHGFPNCDDTALGLQHQASTLMTFLLLEGSAMMPFKTILFATDFSPTSAVAFNVAAALARDYRARVIALHVIEPVRVGFSEYGNYIGPEEDKVRATELLNAIEAPSPRVTMEHRMMEGAPAEVIVETAAEVKADLIVLGTHGRTGFTRLVMGSVAEEVLRNAPCPVLTIRSVINVPTEETDEAVEGVPEVLSI